MGSPNASRRQWLHKLALAALLTVPLGCLSPTLPLPPPGRPDVSPPDGSGITTLIGRVPGGTTAIAFNLDSGRLVGQVTDDDGEYELAMPAEIGDQIAIWYRDGLTESGAVEVTVPATQADLGPLGGATGSD